MIALIDYDNIPFIERQRGLVYIVTRIAGAIGVTRLATENSLLLRLYGGWFREAILSHEAQQLVPQVTGDFPRTLAVTEQGTSTKIKVRAEMAYTLLCDPHTRLTHTYRPRSIPPKLMCNNTPFRGCINPSACPIAELEVLLNTGYCPMPGCSVTPETILIRPEQKLVDSMIIVDLVYWAQRYTEAVALVSTDDDFWPGIRFALILGAEIIHIHPKPGRMSPPQYIPLAVGNYTQTWL